MDRPHPRLIADIVRGLGGAGASVVPAVSGYVPSLDPNAPPPEAVPIPSYDDFSGVVAVNDPRYRRGQGIPQPTPEELALEEAPEQAPQMPPPPRQPQTAAAITGNYIDLDTGLAAFEGHVVELIESDMRALSLILTRAVERKLASEIARVKGNYGAMQQRKRGQKKPMSRRSRTAKPPVSKMPRTQETDET